MINIEIECKLKGKIKAEEISRLHILLAKLSGNYCLKSSPEVKS